MSLGVAWDYYQSMEMLECREDLLSANVSAFPHKKMSKQKEYTKKLDNGMTCHLYKPEVEMSMEDVYFDLVRTLSNG